MFILCCTSSGSEFWSVKHTSIHENSESKVFQNIKFWGEIPNNWPNDLLGTYVYKTWILLIIIVYNIAMY